MRILFLHEVNYLTKPIFEMHEFPEHLARLGHEVGFVHFPEGYSKSQIRELGWRRGISGRVVDGVELDLFTPWAFSGGLPGRLFAATVSYWQFKRVLRAYRPNVVVSFSVPTSGWQALLASKRANVPYVFRALDVSHGIRKGWFSRLVKAAERFIYRRADSVSANNPAMLDYCQKLANQNVASAVHSPPLDLASFSAGDRNRGRGLLNLSSADKVVLYMGTFFYFSGLVEVLTEFNESDSRLKLVLIGGGEQDLELRRLSVDLGISDKVIFTGMVPFDELPDLLASADVAINPMEKTLVSHSALPNKVLQYMAAGVPVVSTELNGLVSTFGFNSGITWGNSPSHVARLAMSLALSSDSEAASVSAARAIEGFKRKADPREFADFLERVISGR